MKKELLVTLTDGTIQRLDLAGFKLAIGVKPNDASIQAIMELVASRGFGIETPDGNLRYIGPGFIKFIDVEFTSKVNGEHTLQIEK